MKKLLSAILVLTLLLSTLSILPVSANGAEEAQVGDTKMSFAALVADFASYVSSEITLLADVDATALTASLATFSGKLNGNGKAINNLSVPLFEGLNGATVENLTINGSIGTAEARYAAGTAVGKLANSSDGTVTVNNVVINADLYATIAANSQLGGFIGKINAGTVNAVSCVNNGVVNVDGAFQGNTGGFIGQLAKAGTEFNATACLNNGDILVNHPAKWANISGFVGRVENVVANITLKKCVNAGDLGVADSSDTKTQFRAGAFGGSMRTKVTGVVTIQSCINYGTVKTYNENGSASGFVAETHGVVNIYNSYSYGALNVKSMYGGAFIGQISENGKSNDFTITIKDSAAAPKDGTDLAVCGDLTYGKLALDNVVLIGTPGDVKTNASGVEGISGVVTSFGKNSKHEYVTGADSVKIYADKATWETATSEIDVVGYQATAVDTATNTFKVRIVTTVSSLEYDAVGFEIIRYDENGAGAIVKITTKAYTSLLGNDGTIYTPEAEKEGAEYFVPFVIEGVPADGSVTFHVRPYVVEGETVTYGETYVDSFSPESN